MLVQRMIRAARLDVQLYEEVEHDASLTGQAATIVVIATVLSAVGSTLLHFRLLGLLTAIALNLVGWIVFAALSYLIGTKAFQGKATLGEMLRVLGFAATPLCLGIIPVIGVFVGAIWTILTTVIALRQGLDVSTGKAIVTAVLSVVAYVLVALVLAPIMTLP